MRYVMKNYLLIVLILLPFGQSQAVDFRDNKPTILITGANRGLGLEFARQYAALDWNVIASCRSPRKASELKKLAQEYPYIAIEKLDVTKDRQVKKLAKKYSVKVRAALGPDNDDDKSCDADVQQTSA